MKIPFRLFLLLTAAAAETRAAVVYVPLPPAPEWVHAIENYEDTFSPKIDFNGDGAGDLMVTSGFGGVQVFMTTNVRVGSRAGMGVAVYEGAMIGQTIQSPLGTTSPIWTNGAVWPPGFYPPEWNLLPSKRELAIAGIAGVEPVSTFKAGGGYLAVEITLEDGVHYGWLHFENDGTQWVVGGRVTGYAYETVPGVPLRAGAIPEPAALSLSLAGAGAACFFRRRPRQSCTASPAAGA